MERIDIIDTIGRAYHTSNVENGEFRYPKALKERGLTFEPIGRPDGNGAWHVLDLRFECDGVSVLVETKTNADKWAWVEDQISAYVEYERQLTGNKVVAIVANTSDDRVMVWRDEVSDDMRLAGEVTIRDMGEYVDMFAAKRANNKEEVVRNTYQLNELLHRHGVSEKLRSQFVGTCLLAIKHVLVYDRKMKTAQIIGGIRTILEDLLEGSMRKAEKLALIDRRVLKDQDIRDMSSDSFCTILEFIESKIFPFINDKSAAGQDLLNLFFITFNKYVGKSDKNQAFTPDHITDFMGKLCNINRNSVVLDMTCGSGAFLVRAMAQALADCRTLAEEEEVKRSHIYGVEYDELVYGLATTNMLIHGDGNSNIVQGSCFDEVPAFISDGVRFNTVLMNPPYNATAKQMPVEFTKTWGSAKQDPTKGLYFVKFILDQMNANGMSGKLAVLLPMSCAIGSSKLMQQVKTSILDNNTLDAVFTLPDDVFHPGANVNSCCMVFDVGTPHTSAGRETFFAYCKHDGFVKKKNLGRVERVNADGVGEWAKVERMWIDTYRNRDVIPGFSARRKVGGSDEWLCEAYMDTDYSRLTDADFRREVNAYRAYLITSELDGEEVPVDASRWGRFRLGGDGGIFDVKRGCGISAAERTPGNVPYVSSTRYNNGVSDHVDVEPNSKGDTISLNSGGSVGEAFYQPKDYWASNHVTELSIKSEFGTLTPEAGLFVCAVLRLETYRYSFGRVWTLDKIADTEISLPVASDGTPDWEFMHSYMCSLRGTGAPSTHGATTGPLALAVDGWRTFTYSELFSMVRGTYGKSPELQDRGSIPFLGATSRNNGVVGYLTDDEVSAGEARTLAPSAVCVNNNGSVGFASFQSRPFAASSDVTALYRKDGEFNARTGQFVAAVIELERPKWSYGRKWNVSRMADSTIKLPATSDGTPDWDFMERYIRSLPHGDEV